MWGSGGGERGRGTCGVVTGCERIGGSRDGGV